MELLTGVHVAKMMPRPPVSSFMYSSNTSLIKRYIEPYLGNIKLKEIMARSLEKYYQTLLKAPATRRMTDRKNKRQHRTIAEASAVESPIRQETIGFPAHFFARAHNFKPPGRACQPEADSPMRT